jgi:hypothetical protein
MDELEKLEKRVTKSLEQSISILADDPLDVIFDIQPPNTVIHHAAQAAAAVLLAFERGYRMDDRGCEK